MGRNLINYPEDVGTPTANLLLIKFFFEQCHIDARSQVCWHRSRQLLPHDSIEKAPIRKDKLSDIPEEVIKEYNLHQYATPDD